MAAPALRKSVLSLTARPAPVNIPARLAFTSLRSSGKRTLITSSLTSRSIPSTYPIAAGVKQKICLDLSHIRYKSDEATDTFRKWGFEEISSSLPASSAESPPSQPQKNLILIDVREPSELVDTGIIPSAVSVPLQSQPDAYFLSEDEFETRFGYPKPGVEEDEGDIVFYCKAGVRAKTAAALAIQAGYNPERVGIYEGSWLDWMERGGKVDKWQKR